MTRCMHCSKESDGLVPAVTSYDKYTKRYELFGSFCCENCALGFLKSHNYPVRAQDTCRQYFVFHRGCDPRTLEAAPPTWETAEVGTVHKAAESSSMNILRPTQRLKSSVKMPVENEHPPRLLNLLCAYLETAKEPPAKRTKVSGSASRPAASSSAASKRRPGKGASVQRTIDQVRAPKRSAPDDTPSES